MTYFSNSLSFSLENLKSVLNPLETLKISRQAFNLLWLLFFLKLVGSRVLQFPLPLKLLNDYIFFCQTIMNIIYAFIIINRERKRKNQRNECVNSVPIIAVQFAIKNYCMYCVTQLPVIKTNLFLIKIKPKLKRK